VIGPSQRPLPDNTQLSQGTDIHAPDGIRTRCPNKRSVSDPPRCHWDLFSTRGNWHSTYSTRLQERDLLLCVRYNALIYCTRKTAFPKTVTWLLRWSNGQSNYLLPFSLDVPIKLQVKVAQYNKGYILYYVSTWSKMIRISQTVCVLRLDCDEPVWTEIWWSRQVFMCTINIKISF